MPGVRFWLVNTVRVDVAIDPDVRVTVDGVGVAPTLLIEAVRETVPENPEMLVTVIVAVPVCPDRTAIEFGTTEMVKPVRLRESMTWWDNEPMKPVTVTLYLPGSVAVVDEMVSIEVAVLPGARVTLDGERESERPGDDAEGDRLTVPEKLPRLVRVIVEVADEPAGKDDGVTGVAERPKSAMATLNLII